MSESDETNRGEGSSAENAGVKTASEYENKAHVELVYDDTTIKQHPSYEQVILDVNRCAGRLQLLRHVYMHRNDDESQSNDDWIDVHSSQSETDQEDTSEQNQAVRKRIKKGEGDEEGKRDKPREVHTRRRKQQSNPVAREQRIIQSKLAKLIVKLLIENPDHHYYQGFHDVCLTYMSMYGEDEAFERLRKLVNTHFNTFMMTTMAETQQFMSMISIIVGLHDYNIQLFLERAQVGTIFALSWVITWFSHVIPEDEDVKKVFEFLQSKDPHMILYLSAEVVVLHKDRLMALEPEMSTIHHFLSDLPKREKLPIDDLILAAEESYKKWPPELVKKRLESDIRNKRIIQRFHTLKNYATLFVPNISNVDPRTKTALIVFVIASLAAIQLNRWYNR